MFQDEGQTNMLEAMRAWRGTPQIICLISDQYHHADVGFKGPIRPDHVPLLACEEGHPSGNKAKVISVKILCLTPVSKGYYSGKASGYTMMGRLFAGNNDSNSFNLTTSF